MLGHTVETLRSLTVREIFLNVPSSKDGLVSAIRERDEHIVELMHADGWTVRAKMSKSALPAQTTCIGDVPRPHPKTLGRGNKQRRPS